jgi:hypothetical protein
MNTENISNEEQKQSFQQTHVICRNNEVGNLIADALLGKMSMHTAKKGSSYDRQRKQIVKEITKNIYGDHKWHLNVDDMLRIFKEGMKYGR